MSTESPQRRNPTLREAIYAAAQRFVTSALKSDKLSFQIVWDVLQPSLEAHLKGESLKLSFKKPSTFLGMAGDKSKLLIAVSTATFAATLSYISNQKVSPDATEIGLIISTNAKQFGAPRSLIKKMTAYLPPLIQEMNFFESVRGAVEEDRDVWLPGKPPQTLSSRKVQQILTKKLALIVDEDKRSVVTNQGALEDLTKSPFDVLVLVLKSHDGICRYEKLFAAFWPQDASRLMELTRKLKRAASQQDLAVVTKLNKEKDGLQKLLAARLRQYVDQLNASLEKAGFPKNIVTAKSKEGYEIKLSSFCVLGVPRFAIR